MSFHFNFYKFCKWIIKSFTLFCSRLCNTCMWQCFKVLILGIDFTIVYNIRFCQFWLSLFLSYMLVNLRRLSYVLENFKKIETCFVHYKPMDMLVDVYLLIYSLQTLVTKHKVQFRTILFFLFIFLVFSLIFFSLYYTIKYTNWLLNQIKYNGYCIYWLFEIVLHLSWSQYFLCLSHHLCV